MKIDFRKIEVTDLDGNKSTVDVAKGFANTIYRHTGDLGEFNLAQDIYWKGEVDISPEQAESLKKYTYLFVRVIDGVSVRKALLQEK
ncbi:hypothetical protein [uncultured Bacteroides sp.]|uniref:hypothetical protein n=1 Tax=uncultured Bacteroides sp. TaxID=162156 RepID=UPI002629FE87|nr:hypothetical protein [uncultured Bacteroides sp.]